MADPGEKRAAFRSLHDAPPDGGHAYDPFSASFRGASPGPAEPSPAIRPGSGHGVELKPAEESEAPNLGPVPSQRAGEGAYGTLQLGDAPPPAAAPKLRHRESALSVSNVDTPFYWTYRFQAALQTNDFGASVSEVASDFSFAAQSYGRVIILEQALPVHQQTIKSVDLGGVAGGIKFVVAGIVFKFAVNHAGVYESDADAMKVAGHELRGATALFSLLEEQRHHRVQVPLMALVDYRGHRLQAMAQLPIDQSTLVYGSDDKGENVVNSDRALSHTVGGVLADLNLCEHVAGRAKQASIFGPTDIEGHRVGAAYYMCDLARLFPPEGPPAGRCGHLTQLLRPEFVKRYHRPLSSDAFSMMVTSDPSYEQRNRDVQEATRLLNDTCVECARMLDLLFLRRGRVRDIVSLVRAYGINMRRLGVVRAACFNAGARQALLQEIVQRTVKNDVREQLRMVAAASEKGLPHEVPYLHAVVRYLNLLVAAGDEASAFRRSALKAGVEKRFPRTFSAHEARPEAELLVSLPLHVQGIFAALSESVGVVLTGESTLMAVHNIEALREAADDGEALAQLREGGGFQLFAADVMVLEPRVKSVEVVSMSQGETLLDDVQVLLQREGMPAWGQSFSRKSFRGGLGGSFRAHDTVTQDIACVPLAELLKVGQVRWHDATRRGRLARARPTLGRDGEYGVLSSAVAPALLPLLRRATQSLTQWARANPARIAGRIELAKAHMLAGVLFWDLESLELAAEDLQLVLDLLDYDRSVALEMLLQLIEVLAAVTDHILRPVYLQRFKFYLSHYYKAHVFVRDPVQVKAAGEHVRLLLHMLAVAVDAKSRIIRRSRRVDTEEAQRLSRRLEGDSRVETVQARVRQWQRRIEADTLFVGGKAVGHWQDVLLLIGFLSSAMFFAANNTRTYFGDEGLSQGVRDGLSKAMNVGACTSGTISLIVSWVAFRESLRYCRGSPLHTALTWCIPLAFLPSYVGSMLWYTDSVPGEWKEGDAQSLITLWHLASLFVVWWAVYIPLGVLQVSKALRNRRMGVGARISFVCFDSSLLLSFFDLDRDAVDLLAEVDLEARALAGEGEEDDDDGTRSVVSASSARRGRGGAAGRSGISAASESEMLL